MAFDGSRKKESRIIFIALLYIFEELLNHAKKGAISREGWLNRAIGSLGASGVLHLIVRASRIAYRIIRDRGRSHYQ